MATTKNITMKQFNGTDYDTLYPKTIASQVDGVYNKTETLSATTAALYGLGTDAVPDDVLALIKTLVDNVQNSADGKAKIEKQNYIGTGVAGQSAPTSVTFSFVPKIVFLSLLTDNGGSLSAYVNCCLLIPSTGRGAMFYERNSVRLYVSLNEKTVSWYSASGDVDEQLNRSGWEYEAYAIG